MPVLHMPMMELPCILTVVQVSWSFAFKQRALLNLSNKRQAFENQTLQVGSVCRALPCVWLADGPTMVHTRTHHVPMSVHRLRMLF
jgi:hypothetical protein